MIIKNLYQAKLGALNPLMVQIYPGEQTVGLIVKPIPPGQKNPIGHSMHRTYFGLS
jgi:hypothetical protein